MPALQRVFAELAAPMRPHARKLEVKVDTATQLYNELGGLTKDGHAYYKAQGLIQIDRVAAI